MGTEIWKDVPGYEGLYQCSSLGRLKSFKWGAERIFKTRKDKNKYITCCLRKNGVKKCFKVHQIIAITFFNHIPNGHTLVVDHINEIKTDNRVSNLQIVTHKDNINNCYRREKQGCTSKYKGVYFQKQGNKWRSDISVNGKTKHLGYFKTEIDAYGAYQKELLLLNIMSPSL